MKTFVIEAEVIEFREGVAVVKMITGNGDPILTVANERLIECTPAEEPLTVLEDSVTA